MKTCRQVCTFLVCVAILFGLSGCSSHVSTGTSVTPAKISKIVPGKTTKKELFDLMGPPMAIAIQGRPLYLLQPFMFDPGVWGTDIDYSLKLQSEPFFELFSSDINISNEDRVYYYYHGESNYDEEILYAKNSLEMDHLWVLVNEETELVEGIYFLPHKRTIMPSEKAE